MLRSFELERDVNRHIQKDVKAVAACFMVLSWNLSREPEENRTNLSHDGQLSGRKFNLVLQR
jgi:hypothetical protein